MDKRELVKKVLIQSVYAIMQILFSRINLHGVSPVGISFAMIRIFCGQNIFLVTSTYALSKIYLFGSLNLIFATIYEIVMISLYYFTKEFLNTNKDRMLLSVFVGISTALHLYYGCSSLESLVIYLIDFVLKIIFVLYFYKFFQVFKNKFLFFKFSNFDYLIFSIMVLFLALGLFSFGWIYKFCGIFLVSILVLFSVRILPSDKFFVLTSVFAFGVFVVTKDSFYLLFTVLCSICFINFKEINKYIFSLVAVLVFVCFVYFYKLYLFFEYLSLVFAVFLYILLPTKLESKMASLFDQDATSVICSYVQENKIFAIKNKLQKMSDTFLTMQNDLKFLLVGKIDREKASVELAQDVVNKCCKNCENFRHCFMENINKRALFESLLLRAFEDKQVSKEDMSNGLQSYCMKSGIVVNEINQIARLFLSYENTMKQEDTSKLLIAGELANFSDIFANFAKMLKYSLKINKNQSKILKEHLLNNLIDTKEVVILENDLGVESINIIASNEEILKKEVSESIGTFVKNKIKIKEIKHLDFSGMSLATFVPSNRFRIDFAVSTKAKELQNGDNVVVTKLSESKFFVALSDGMGHGENANRISSMVLSLIKSMFEVGLDDELIVQSVNKLLLPAGLDNFTTLDACVIDLEKEVCSFIKLGSSVSILKHKNTSEVVACESLPIGIVQNIKPTIIRKHIAFDDIIFLASDGVVDSFSNVESFKTFINDAKIYNLQKYVDAVVFDAGFQNTKHPDDMTIIAINLLKN